jgi:hypothetical protein
MLQKLCGYLQTFSIQNFMPKVFNVQMDEKIVWNDDITTKVVKALENDQYVWRSLDGIKSETGLSLEEINYILKDLAEKRGLAHAIKPSTGINYYTTIKHWKEKESGWNKVLSSVSGSYRI